MFEIYFSDSICSTIRTNVDGVFIFREPNLKIRKCIYENYAGIIPDFSIFCFLMDNLTDDHQALYIQSSSTSNKLEDNVFYYKAKPVPKGFKFGSPEYWDFNNERMDPEKDKNIEI